MRIFVFISTIIFFALFVSCNGKTKQETSDVLTIDTTKSFKIGTSWVTPKPAYDFDSTLKLSNADNHWFSVKLQPLHNEKKISKAFVSDTIKKYGRAVPYNMKYASAKDSTTISFNFNTYCCMLYSADASIVRDTLVLKYFQTDSDACACYTDYKLAFTIANNYFMGKKIKIRHSDNISK